MARKSSGLLGSFNSLRPLTKIFYTTAFMVLLIVPTAITQTQNTQQEAKGPGRYTVTLTSSNPTFGGNASFSVIGGNVSTGTLWLVNSCSQNGSVVYKQYLKIGSDGNSGPFTLGPTPSWASGEAGCTATVISFNNGAQKDHPRPLSYTVLP